MFVSTTASGLHYRVRKKLNSGFFSKDEESIVRKLGQEWYVTRIGKLTIGTTSRYKFALMKPTETYQEMFNLDREIVVIFSPYNSFQPRSLDAFDAVLKLFQTLRLEKICYLLFSKDDRIEQKIQDLLKSNQESQVIIPLSYTEFLATNEDYYLKNKFKKFFYTRDLFAFESPLKRDLYFFGRTNLVQRIVNRHKANENSGLFGLRKTGKTSVIFGVIRTLQVEGELSVFIDCQNPSFHIRRWNKALHYIVTEIISQQNIHIERIPEDKYTEENASLLFEHEMLNIRQKIHGKSILMIFDEIENITFGISPSDHWESGLDFVYFWQTLRSVFQKHNRLLSYLIVGTNPMCVEKPNILGKDNPIFNNIPFEYIERFDVPQTREMVKKLGNFMGLNFEENLYAKLTEDYGGHPFLIRHVCSLINSMCNSDRPASIGRLLYDQVKAEFDMKYHNYIDMILSVLKDYYIEEFKMLEDLALGNIQTFSESAASYPLLTSHLKGYGIIEETVYGYDFKIDAVKAYLIQSNRYRKIGLSQLEKYHEISERRNEFESKLRKLVRSQLKANFGETQAKDNVLDIFGAPRKQKYTALSYKDLFDANKVEIYLEDLRKIIKKYWTVFEFIFSRDQEKFNLNMQMINRYRVDSHAKDISDDDFALFRVCMNWLEEHVYGFLD